MLLGTQAVLELYEIIAVVKVETWNADLKAVKVFTSKAVLINGAVQDTIVINLKTGEKETVKHLHILTTCQLVKIIRIIPKVSEMDTAS